MQGVPAVEATTTPSGGSCVDDASLFLCPGRVACQTLIFSERIENAAAEGDVKAVEAMLGEDPAPTVEDLHEAMIA